MTLTRRIAVGLGAAVFTIGVGVMACAYLDLSAAGEKPWWFRGEHAVGYLPTTTPPRMIFLTGAITAAIGAGLFAGARRE